MRNIRGAGGEAPRLSARKSRERSGQRPDRRSLEAISLNVGANIALHPLKPFEERVPPIVSMREHPAGFGVEARRVDVVARMGAVLKIRTECWPVKDQRILLWGVVIRLHNGCIHSTRQFLTPP